MIRLTQYFEQLRRSGRTALVTYISAADPSPERTVGLMHLLVENGADVLELGMPFSDPMADGPVIQQAFQRALKHNVTLEDVLGMVEEFRRGDAVTPVVLMGYLNPVEAFGTREFATRAAGAGVDGVIVVDLPPEEARIMGVIKDFDLAGVAPIFLLSPTTSEARMQYICSEARGFVYYVSIKGVTGASHFDNAETAMKVATIRRYTELPIAVGFGIKSAASAAEVASFADAVVIGSALVDVITHSSTSDEYLESVATFLRPIRAAIDASVSIEHLAVQN